MAPSSSSCFLLFVCFDCCFLLSGGCRSRDPCCSLSAFRYDGRPPRIREKGKEKRKPPVTTIVFLSLSPPPGHTPLSPRPPPFSSLFFAVALKTRFSRSPGSKPVLASHLVIYAKPPECICVDVSILVGDAYMHAWTREVGQRLFFMFFIVPGLGRRVASVDLPGTSFGLGLFFQLIALCRVLCACVRLYVYVLLDCIYVYPSCVYMCVCVFTT